MVTAMLPVKWIDRALAAAAVLGCVLVAGSALAQSPGSFSTLSTTGTATLDGDVLMCSGHPWIDVRCNGAVGDDTHDDTGAIQTTIDSAVANNCGIISQTALKRRLRRARIGLK